MNTNKLTIGAIIGSTFLYDVKHYNNREEFERDRHKHFSIVAKFFEGYRYRFLIRNAMMLNHSILSVHIIFLLTNKKSFPESSDRIIYCDFSVYKYGK